jgi:DNA-binding SARP family transcriptional activator
MSTIQNQDSFEHPILRIWLLGHPTIQLGNQLFETHLNTRTRALIYYLVVNHQTHTRDELATLFWDDMPNVQARKNLRNILPFLRHFLSSYVMITHQTITFNHHTSFWLDVDVFSLLLTPPLDKVATNQLWEAVRLYQGDFLHGIGVRHAPQFEEWMMLERERLRAMVLDALTILAERHIQEHDYQRGITATRYLLELEPWNETAHQQQMLMLALQGRRESAMAQYDICCRIIDAEFQMGPLPETTALYHTIQLGKLHNTRFLLPSTQVHTIQDHAPFPSPPTPCTKNHTDEQTVPLGNSMCISPDGNLLAESTHGSIITLWNIRSGTIHALLEGHDDIISALACGSSGVVASGSNKGTIYLWDVMSGKLRHKLYGHSGRITILTFTLDGTLLASGSSDGTIYLWNTSVGTIQHKLSGHTALITTIAFSPKQDSVISGCNNRRVRTWSLQTGKCLTTFECAAGTG